MNEWMDNYKKLKVWGQENINLKIFTKAKTLKLLPTFEVIE